MPLFSLHAGRAVVGDCRRVRHLRVVDGPQRHVHNKGAGMQLAINSLELFQRLVARRRNATPTLLTSNVRHGALLCMHWCVCVCVGFQFFFFKKMGDKRGKKGGRKKERWKQYSTTRLKRTQTGASWSSCAWPCPQSCVWHNSSHEQGVIEFMKEKKAVSYMHARDHSFANKARRAASLGAILTTRVVGGMSACGWVDGWTPCYFYYFFQFHKKKIPLCITCMWAL